MRLFTVRTVELCSRRAVISTLFLLYVLYNITYNKTEPVMRISGDCAVTLTELTKILLLYIFKITNGLSRVENRWHFVFYRMEKFRHFLPLEQFTGFEILV